jgi:hypothetical protein
LFSRVEIILRGAQRSGLFSSVTFRGVGACWAISTFSRARRGLRHYRYRANSARAAHWARAERAPVALGQRLQEFARLWNAFQVTGFRYSAFVEFELFFVAHGFFTRRNYAFGCLKRLTFFVAKGFQLSKRAMSPSPE